MDNNKPKILAIDDNRDNLISIKALIREAFPDAVRLTAENGAAGIELAQAEDPDVILLDVVMPGMDGFEVCRKLKANPQTSDIPVVFLTALGGDRASRIRALEVGAEAFLAKPVDEQELVAQIRAMQKIKRASTRARQEKVALTQMVAEKTRELELSHTAALALLADLRVENENRKQNEIALSQSEAALKQAQNVAHVGSWAWHIQSNWLEWSDEMYRIFGIAKADFNGDLGSVISQAIHPDDRAAVDQSNESVAKHKQPIPLEYRIIRPDGAVRVVWAEAGELTLDDAGLAGTLTGIVMDVTERRKTENALRESEARFRATIEQSFDGILIVDDAYQIIEWNTAQTTISGYTREEMLGRMLWDYHSAILPDQKKSMDFIEALQEKILNSGSQNANSVMNSLITLNIQRKDGGYKTVQISIFPIEVLQKRYHCAITRDITAIQTAQQNYQMLFREMLDGFALHEILLDEQGKPADYRYLSVNPAFERLTGLRGADILSKTVLEVLPGTESYWIDTYGRVALTGEPHLFEAYSQTIDKHFEISAFRPALNQFACVFKDVTRRKRADQDLQTAYIKLEALWSISSLEDADVKNISDHILMTIARMTGSEYGFYGFINEDESLMTIHSWSGEAMKDCAMVDKPMHYAVSESGVWAEAIRRREPLILNNYSAEHPAKKGLPDGHVALTNLLVVPHLLHGKIISVAAVANRMADYNQEDVIQITTFLTSIEAIIDSKRSEETLRGSESRFKAVSEYSHNSICLIDERGKIIWVNEAFLQMSGYAKEQIYAVPSFVDTLAPESIEFVVNNFNLFLKKEPYEHHYTFYFIRADGEKRLCEKHMTDYVDRHGNRILALSMLDITDQKLAEQQINDQLTELRRWHNITLGREDRILELKREINSLLAEAGKPPRFAG